MPSYSVIWCGVKKGGVDQSETEGLSPRFFCYIFARMTVRSILP